MKQPFELGAPLASPRTQYGLAASGGGALAQPPPTHRHDRAHGPRTLGLSCFCAHVPWWRPAVSGTQSCADAGCGNTINATITSAPLGPLYGLDMVGSTPRATIALVTETHGIV